MSILRTSNRKSQYGDEKEQIQIEEFFSNLTEEKQKKKSLEVAKKLTPKDE